ncbi:MAG: hypothetical protein KC656_19930 [Myxococcales bacterium]|nr:hypothetical protein [Myxococcales bacterium]
MMQNTLLVDTDLVYARPNETDPIVPDGDDLVEIGFEDMEPVAGFDLVGIEPHTAIAILPFVEFDLVGVAPHFALTTTPAPAFPRAPVDLEPDCVPTEEFASWEHDHQDEAAF